MVFIHNSFYFYIFSIFFSKFVCYLFYLFVFYFIHFILFCSELKFLLSKVLLSLEFSSNIYIIPKSALCASVVPTGCSQESTSRRKPGGVCAQSLHSGKFILTVKNSILLQLICRNVVVKIQSMNSFICKNNP